MSRILLVDDSPHAQRMGERILSDEGYEVVTVSNADAALVRLEDVDPDIVLADAVMPGRTGYDICQFVKMSPRHRHVRVILTAGATETLDEAHTKRVEADGTLRKPFEASVLLAAVRALADAAVRERQTDKPGAPGPAPVDAAPLAPFIAVVDAEQIRAAVTVALDAAMGAMVEEITRRVMAALDRKKPDAQALPLPVAQPAATAPAAAPPVPPPAPVPPPEPAAPTGESQPASPPPAMPRIAAVRRVTPLRLRTGSILGLDIGRFDPSPPPVGPETPDPEE
jgi:CheY-like chemotaxis protein